MFFKTVLILTLDILIKIDGIIILTVSNSMGFLFMCNIKYYNSEVKSITTITAVLPAECMACVVRMYGMYMFLLRLLTEKIYGIRVIYCT
jgi:hypothetical protein